MFLSPALKKKTTKNPTKTTIKKQTAREIWNETEPWRRYPVGFKRPTSTAFVADVEKYVFCCVCVSFYYYMCGFVNVCGACSSTVAAIVAD